MPTIEIYPNVPKPDWVKPGVKCYVWGEAFDEFTIEQVFSNKVTLLNNSGHAHGAESFTKLHKNKYD